MSAAHQDVRPGRQATARRTGIDAAPDGVQHVLRRFAAKDGTAKGGNHAAFKTEPVVQVIGEIGVDAVEIRGEGRRIEVHEFVADGKIPAITIVARAGLRRSGRFRECGLRRRNRQSCKRRDRRSEFGNERELEGSRG